MEVFKGFVKKIERKEVVKGESVEIVYKYTIDLYGVDKGKMTITAGEELDLESTKTYVIKIEPTEEED